MKSFIDPFLSPNNKPNALIIALFIAINTIVTINCFQHEYTIGYDADDHLTYARVLSEGRLPTPKESMEFFSPPLPYAPAALLRAAGVADEQALKKAKEIQAIYSIVLTFFLLHICLQISGDPRLRVWSLMLLGMIPAYYRSFVMIRGEPMLAMFAVIGMWLSLRTFLDERSTWRSAVALGIIFGCAALSRQWGMLLLPAVALIALYRIIVDRESRARTFTNAAIAACVFAIVASPFYVHLRHRYGSTTAFNRAPSTIERYPASFYLDFPLRTMLTTPVKHHLARRLVPTFYSDFWGDYWCYYAVYARTRGREFRGGLRRSSSPYPKADIVETNVQSMSRYLGRQNAIAVVPTLVLIAGVAVSVVAMLKTLRRRLPPTKPQVVIAFLGACVICSFAGYLAFIVAYPSDTGDTIKATYMLQTFAPLAILGAVLLTRMHDRHRREFWILAALILMAAAHGSYAFFTRYI